MSSSSADTVEPGPPPASSSEARRIRVLAIGFVALLAVVVSSGVAFALVATNNDQSARSGSRPIPEVSVSGVAEVGAAAPQFSAPALDDPGRQIALADFRGDVVVLNFWASWCGPCREEFPILADLNEIAGVTVVGLTHLDHATDAQNFAAAQDATWVLAQDPRPSPIAQAYGVNAVPQTFVIDPDGVIVYRQFGMDEYAVRSAIEAAQR